MCSITLTHHSFLQAIDQPKIFDRPPTNVDMTPQSLSVDGMICALEMAGAFAREVRIRH
jgi:hypothetical protein